VVLVVVVLDAGSVVVVPAAHPLAVHASQQLGTTPTQAWPPAGEWQDAADRLMLQRVSPRAFVRQQVTDAGRRQVDRAAHRTTLPRQFRGNMDMAMACLATWETQRTYAPCVPGPTQLH